MNKIDKEIWLLNYIEQELLMDDEEIPFLGFTKEQLSELFRKDLKLPSGINSLKFPRITSLERLKPLIDISGSESIIYLNPGQENVVYKLNDPSLKVEDNRLNSYCINLILQAFLFPVYEYTDLKRYQDKILMEQVIAKGQPATQDQISSSMKSSGCYETANKDYILDLGEILIKISDLNVRNCTYYNNELQVFDAKFNIL